MNLKALIIINPVSGMKKANRFLTDILTKMCMHGYQCTVQTTTPDCNATMIAEQLANGQDLIICIGGDGTLNETIAGCIAANVHVPVGYIPSGSTNDFANNLGLLQHPIAAIEAILDGEVHHIDVGTFNDRPFVYTASFGIFTKASYSAPREMRNSLGYLAYVLEGVKEIGDIQSYQLCIDAGETVVAGNYIFGGICNSKRIGGGIIHFTDDMVDLNDGKLEVFLVKTPETPAEFMQLVFDLNSGNYNSRFIDFFSATNLRVITNDNIDWTLDGEYQPGTQEINIQVKHSELALKY